MKKERPEIKIVTLNNGYSLSVDGNDFMYFGIKDLLAGFIAHIGAMQSTPMDKETMLNSLFSVMLGQRYAEDVTRLKDAVRRMEQEYDEKTNRLSEAINYVEDAIRQNEVFKKNLKEVTTMNEKMRKTFQSALEPYAEYNQRILDLEEKTKKMESYFKTATKEAQTKLTVIDTLLERSVKTETELSAKAYMLVSRLERQSTDDNEDAEIETPAESKELKTAKQLRNQSVIDKIKKKAKSNINIK